MAKLDWDDKLPADLVDKWLAWYNQVALIDQIKIPRWSGFNPSAQIELHGFADASMKAYAAVVHLRVCLENVSHVRIIQAKTKVSPIKTISIPKLELCGAALLSVLMSKVRKALKLPNCSIHLWTDSTDVLYWLNDHPSRWVTYIVKRCSSIKSSVPEATWHHVRTNDNPADLASRGVEVQDLLHSFLW